MNQVTRARFLRSLRLWLKFVEETPNEEPPATIARLEKELSQYKTTVAMQHLQIRELEKKLRIAESNHLV